MSTNVSYITRSISDEPTRTPSDFSVRVGGLSSRRAAHAGSHAGLAEAMAQNEYDELKAEFKKDKNFKVF